MIDADGRALIAKRNGEQLGANRIFSTPSDIATEAQATNALVENLAATVAAGIKAPQAWLNGFAEFHSRWQNFYGSVSSTLRVMGTRIVTGDLFTNQLAGRLNDFQTEAEAWAAQATKYHAKIPGSRKLPGAGMNPLIYVGVGAIVLVGIFLAVKISRAVALGDSEPGDEGDIDDAEAEALAIIDAKRRKRHARTTYSIA